MSISETVFTVTSPQARLSLQLNAAGDIKRFYETCSNGTVIDFFHGAGKSLNPMMHPWCNRVKDGAFSFEGKDYVLRPLHGEENNALHGRWLAPWSVSEIGDNHVILDVECEAEDGEQDPDRRTPYHHSARQIISLTDDAMTIEMSVTNRGEAALPFGIGMHPFIVRTPGTTVTMHVSRMENCGADMIPDAANPVVSVPAELGFSTGLDISNANLSPPRYGFRHEDYLDNSFPGVDPAAGALITWPDLSREMQVTASANCSFAVCFVPGKNNDLPEGQGSFFCLELTTNGVNMQQRLSWGDEETGAVVLQPGETLNASTRYVVKEI